MGGEGPHRLGFREGAGLMLLALPFFLFGGLLAAVIVAAVLRANGK